ncbi:hypothetical protein ND861_05790 [Leptospira sp. 2 VSF19]|uniref:Tetratricopeptide repeat protein n=1 Tax=Leptospira soteropolitanensis TaxID=2950025 RepID=A0AAW5VKB3_9LEPT|nr:hypothetical protein [Leptospira soteropolitanensis]MCW7492166.1 hypothetical protein [Leptospira soteropolitanensis]MCW7499748.1 hypothetical protein [Leptospira soteropolitanensis]MCW7521999.1 hypothetical protein [Leptospira soteropolitanensis]MCW7525853.1 hypothetical protein [Leptospira soteropolitanensis]MCW7530033.1 hypothetical protein [Leptospira soteropolitanensis]
MAQQATQVLTTSIEKEAWDLYEVGSNEDVVVLAKRHPENFYIQHLGYLALYELTGRVTITPPKGISNLAPLVEAIQNYEMGKTSEASKSLNLYFITQTNPLCFPIIQTAIKIYFKAEAYEEANSVITRFKKQWNDNSFIKEELICTYYLKRYDEVIKVFRDNMKLLNDSDIHKLVGMALLFLDRHKEANLIFENIPGKLNLPSFDEKRKMYDSVYKKISELEAKTSSLNHKDLEDMGFAYLFHGDYVKAEKMFLSLTEKLKSKLCNV